MSGESEVPAGVAVVDKPDQGSQGNGGNMADASIPGQIDLGDMKPTAVTETAPTEEKTLADQLGDAIQKTFEKYLRSEKLGAGVERGKENNLDSITLHAAQRESTTDEGTVVAGSSESILLAQSQPGEVAWAYVSRSNKSVKFNDSPTDADSTERIERLEQRKDGLKYIVTRKMAGFSATTTTDYASAEGDARDRVDLLMNKALVSLQNKE